MNFKDYQDKAINTLTNEPGLKCVINEDCGRIKVLLVGNELTGRQLYISELLMSRNIDVGIITESEFCKINGVERPKRPTINLDNQKIVEMLNANLAKALIPMDDLIDFGHETKKHKTPFWANDWRKSKRGRN
jgi:hypothetical protein